MIAYMCMHDEGIWVKLYTTWELLPIWFVSCVYAAKMELLTNLSYFCVIMFVMHKTWCHSKYPAWITNMANTLKSPASKRILQVKCISYYCGIYTLLSYCELRSICKFTLDVSTAFSWTKWENITIDVLFLGYSEFLLYHLVVQEICVTNTYKK